MVTVKRKIYWNYPFFWGPVQLEECSSVLEVNIRVVKTWLVVQLSNCVITVYSTIIGKLVTTYM